MKITYYGLALDGEPQLFSGHGPVYAVVKIKNDWFTKTRNGALCPLDRDTYKLYCRFVRDKSWVAFDADPFA
jgi:hypothetical protein